MFTKEGTIVTEPERKVGEKRGTEFAVCRFMYTRQEFNKSIGEKVGRNVFIGLTAFGNQADDLMEFVVGQRVAVTGDLQEQSYLDKEGQPASDIKCIVAEIVPREASDLPARPTVYAQSR